MSLRVLSIGTLPPGSSHGAYVRRVMLPFQVFLDMSGVACIVPSKGALPSCSPRRGPRKRRSIYTMLFYCLSKSLVNEPLSRFPSEAAVERDDRFYSFPLHILNDPLSRYHSQSSHWEIRFVPRASLHLSKSPIKRVPLQVPQRATYGETCPFAEPCLTSRGVPDK